MDDAVLRSALGGIKSRRLASFLWIACGGPRRRDELVGENAMRAVLAICFLIALCAPRTLLREGIKPDRAMSSFVPPKLPQPLSLRVVSGLFAIPPFRVAYGPFTTTHLPSMIHPSLAAREWLCCLAPLDKSHGCALLHQLCEPL